MDYVTTRLQMEFGMFFSPWPWKMQGNWENSRNSFCWSANRGQI